jgi:uncharacterized protein (UPF0332 family)
MDDVMAATGLAAVLHDPILTRFRAALDELCGARLERVMLFGSRARGEARAEAARFLEKALELLTRADIMLHVGLNEFAGRNAYLAAFHAAQAYISENAAKVLKTHNGEKAEFPRLTKDDPRIDAELRLFLSRSHPQGNCRLRNWPGLRGFRRARDARPR